MVSRQLGVDNINLDAHQAVDRNELWTVAPSPPDLSLRGYRAIEDNVQGLVAISPRKKFKLQKLLPKTANEPPMLVGVHPNFQEINSLKVAGGGRFFTAEEDRDSAAVYVLGEAALGKYLKANGTWLRGAAGRRPRWRSASCARRPAARPNRGCPDPEPQ